ncbi:hypothetical protein AFLA_010862 [Aspergillus flavus NRRL3357]|nr:hypothetical protein AFLA_010862 [Aspergillus flavus NRRL3357]
MSLPGDVHLFAIAIPTVSSGTRHALVDFYWIIPRTHPPGDFTMHPNQKGTKPKVSCCVAWQRERRRDYQDLVPLSGLILNGSGCLLVVNLHATRPLRRVFFDLGLQPASHTRTLSRFFISGQFTRST